MFAHAEVFIEGRTRRVENAEYLSDLQLVLLNLVLAEFNAW